MAGVGAQRYHFGLELDWDLTPLWPKNHPKNLSRLSLGDSLERSKLSGRFATRFDSRKSFAIETPTFIARQADSPESLELPIHANRASRESIRANHATKGQNNLEIKNIPENS